MHIAPSRRESLPAKIRTCVCEFVHFSICVPTIFAVIHEVVTGSAMFCERVDSPTQLMGSAGHGEECEWFDFMTGIMHGQLRATS